MSYTDLRDFLPEVTYHIYGRTTITISLEKLGGGMPGQAHTGTWRFVVTWDGRETFREQTLHTPTPTTHLGAAALLAGWFAAYGDPADAYQGRGRPSGLALQMCQAEHEALSCWAADVTEPEQPL